MSGDELRLSPTLNVVSAASGPASPPNATPAEATSGDAARGSTGSDGPGSPERPPRRTWMLVAVGVVVIVLVSAGYAIMMESHPAATGSKADVLVPAGTLYTLPVDQYNAVEFAQQMSASVTATLTNVGGALLYVMNPSQYLTLVETYNVSGYEWTSGPIPSDTYYNLQVTIPAGSWDLVFSNSIPGNSTAIGFYSNLVETT